MKVLSEHNVVVIARTDVGEYKSVVSYRNSIELIKEITSTSELKVGHVTYTVKEIEVRYDNEILILLSLD